ncbi:MAG: glycosyltransferase family 39 protein, partial [Chloroflexi bacterium]|nr:glycosyltransferase family 39 protein [Chloroflexota bacterium]
SHTHTLAYSLTKPLAALRLFVLVALVLFAPILPTYFLADDYNYVYHLLVNARAYVQGEQLSKWFIDFSAQGMQVPELSIFFRPVVQWLWLFDFIAYGTDATGYHLTNILLHALNSFLVYILARQILRQRVGALVAGLLFALHPVHSDSVAWIADRTDVLSTFFYFTGAVYFVFYRARARRLFLGVSVAAYTLAIGTKENTVALPAILLAYDLLFTQPASRNTHPERSPSPLLGVNHVVSAVNPSAESKDASRLTRHASQIFRALFPYALVLAAYVAARFALFGEFGRNTGGGFLSFGADLYFQYYALALLQPFFSDINTALFLAILASFALLLAVYRDRRAVWFGALWIAFSLLPAASAAYVAPRLAYAPSAGLALLLAAILPRPFARAPARVGIALSALLIAIYAWGLAARVDNWAAVGTVARIIPEQTKQLVPVPPPDARFYFTGVPMILRAIDLYNENFPNAIQIAYRQPHLFVANVEKFPVITQNLDRAIFLDYRRRVVSENAEARRVLQDRQKCLGVSSPAAQWDFARDAQGWEAWNDLENVQARDDALSMRATGTDPNLGSPLMDVPTLGIGDVEIEMQARAGAPTLRGALYWQIAGQSDFAPEQFQAFDVRADGAFQKYRIDLTQEGKLLIGDRIARLRLDPTDAPAEISIRSIRVFVHCTLTGDSCQCNP